MLTRRQVAARLGKSIATVRRLEGVHLHPRRDADGVYRFAPAEVEAFAADLASRRLTRPGARASVGWKGWLAERLGEPPPHSARNANTTAHRPPSIARAFAAEQADLARQLEAFSALLSSSPRRTRRALPAILEAIEDLLGR